MQLRQCVPGGQVWLRLPRFHTAKSRAGAQLLEFPVSWSWQKGSLLWWVCSEMTFWESSLEAQPRTFHLIWQNCKHPMSYIKSRSFPTRFLPLFLHKLSVICSWTLSQWLTLLIIKEVQQWNQQLNQQWNRFSFIRMWTFEKTVRIQCGEGEALLEVVYVGAAILKSSLAVSIHM